MVELDKFLELVEETKLTWHDKTYRTETGLRRFLDSLTPGQLEETQILVDDSFFVVFYPVFSPVVRRQPESFHYDTSEINGEVARESSINAGEETKETGLKKDLVSLEILLTGIRV